MTQHATSDSMPPLAERPAVELLADGWQRCYEADGRHLFDSIALYHELGFDVALAPAASQVSSARAIFTRDREPGLETLLDAPRV